MDRASQRFKTEVRAVTVGISFLLAFVVGLDAVDLYGRFQADPILRQRVIQKADSLLLKPPVVGSDPGSVPSKEASAAAKTTALAFWKSPRPASHPKSDGVETAATPGPDPEGDRPAPDPPAAVMTEAAAVGWLTGLEKKDLVEDADDAALEGRFREELVRARARLLGRELAGLRSGAGIGGVELRGWAGLGKESLSDQARHVAGVVLGAMLLSLGAPFWFNALQTLVALRPSVASKEDKKAQERRAIG
jgi:hypothetical protein